MHTRPRSFSWPSERCWPQKSQATREAPKRRGPCGCGPCSEAGARAASRGDHLVVKCGTASGIWSRGELHRAGVRHHPVVEVFVITNHEAIRRLAEIHSSHASTRRVTTASSTGGRTTYGGPGCRGTSSGAGRSHTVGGSMTWSSTRNGLVGAVGAWGRSLT